MIYLGIVGALTPLGQKVSEYLKNSPDYQVVFRADEGYEADDPATGVYANLERALSFIMSSTLVIDCADPVMAIHERIPEYRFYEHPAIVCCHCELDELDTIARSCENTPRSSLLTVPDYSVVNTRLMAFFMRQAERHRNDVKSLEIEVTVSDKDRLNLNIWLSWAHFLNEKMGISDEKTEVKGSVCKCGMVTIKVVTDASLQRGCEKVSVTMYHGKEGHIGRVHQEAVNSDVCAAQLDGVCRLLDWFADNQENEDARGNLFINHLSTIMFDKKR